MMTGRGEFIEVRFERFDVEVCGVRLGLGRPIRKHDSAATQSLDSWVLAPVASNETAEQAVAASSALRIPGDLPPKQALAVPRLALALWVWDLVHLELGEVALFTSGSPLERYINQVALWRSGRAVMRLDFGDSVGHPPPDVIAVDGSDPQQAIASVHAACSAAPGFAAVVLSEKSAALDVVLEAAPNWGRIVFAAATAESATVDFYTNVHRKGIRMLAGPASTGTIVEQHEQPVVRGYLDRATRLMMSAAVPKSLLED